MTGTGLLPLLVVMYVIWFFLSKIKEKYYNPEDNYHDEFGNDLTDEPSPEKKHDSGRIRVSGNTTERDVFVKAEEPFIETAIGVNKIAEDLW